jgi:hypothetical protein
MASSSSASQSDVKAEAVFPEELAEEELEEELKCDEGFLRMTMLGNILLLPFSTTCARGVKLGSGHQLCRRGC